MPDIQRAGLLAPLPRQNVYAAQEYVPVPLTGVQLRVQVVNFVSQVEVIQEYQNKEKNPIEVTYFFPIEEEAAVTECSAELEGRTVVTKISEKAEAHKIYDDAIQDNKTAFLLEETKADIFQLHVGNLSPGAKCKVKITYIMELPVEDGKTKLTIPTTVAPRYTPAETDYKIAMKLAGIHHDFRTPAALNFQLDILMKTKISSITSSSHTLVSNLQENPNNEGLFHASSSFDGLTSEMDRDIIILVGTEEPTHPKIILERGEDGSVAALVSIVPQFDLRKQPSEVIFLIDCSGSMTGDSIELARDALHLFVHSLPVDCFFNIYLFGSTFMCLFPESKPFNDETLEMAEQLMTTLDADLGGTEVYQPLETIFKSKSLVGKPRQVFVITDGQVSNSQECVHLVEKHNQRNRVFTLGIGACADRHLVKGMARAGMGVASFTTSGEKIAGKLLKQLKQSLQPCVHDVQFDWGEGTTGGAIDCQAPLKNPPLYDGTRMLVYKLWDKGVTMGEKVTITAEKPGGQMSVEVNIEADSCIKGDLIHKMFARKMIQDLEEKYVNSDTEETKSLITDFGLKYSLVTKYTSFVGFDKESSNEAGTMVKRQVRNMIGMDGSRGRDRRNRSRSRDRGTRRRSRSRDREEKRRRSRSRDRKEKRRRSRSRDRKEKRRRSRSRDRGTRRRSRSRERNTENKKSRSNEEEAAVGRTKEKAAVGRTEEKYKVGRTEEKHKLGRTEEQRNLLMLTSLQSAVGYFKENESIEKLIGQKFGIFRKECMDKGIETRVWLTALIIAFVEREFADDKDSWEMIVEKAREWLGGDEIVLAAHNCFG